jgi:hypothetical protein
MAVAYHLEAYDGAHDAVRFSADVQSFVVSNAVSAWSDEFGAWTRWTGSEWSTGNYLGYVAIGLSAAGLADRRVRVFLGLAAVGCILALGPRLQVGGSVYEGLALPYGVLELAVPLLTFGGIPARFGWLATFGLALAAGRALVLLRARGRAGSAVAVILVGAALVETWPKPMAIQARERPEILGSLPKGNGRMAVLDTTERGQALWNQMGHQRPMVSGYVTRLPRRIWTSFLEDGVVRDLFPPPLGPHEGPKYPSEGTDIAMRLAEMNVGVVIVDAKEVEWWVQHSYVLVYLSAAMAILEVPQSSEAKLRHPH